MELQHKAYRLTLTEPLLGSISKSGYAETIINDRAPDPERAGEEIATLPVEQDKGATGFHSNESGLFVYDYVVKGFVKEAGNTMKELVGHNGKKGEAGTPALRSKLDNYLFVFPRRVYIMSEAGEIVTEPDGVFERPLRAMTAQGPRVTIARSDMVNEGVHLDVTFRLLPHREINFDLIEELLDYGQLKGLGQFRNGSFGRFTWEELVG
jgi:hypothetical protein